MGRRPSDLDDYLEWQQRLESYKGSGLTIEVFCLQEGVSRSAFHRWARRTEVNGRESAGRTRWDSCQVNRATLGRAETTPLHRHSNYPG